MKISELKKKKWFVIASSIYVIILTLFVVWMFFFDTNSYFIHKELSNEIEALEETRDFYKKEIDRDKAFIEKMKDSNEVERYARENYYLKKENEDIYIIEDADSLKAKKNHE